MSQLAFTQGTKTGRAVGKVHWIIPEGVRS